MSIKEDFDVGKYGPFYRSGPNLEWGVYDTSKIHTACYCSKNNSFDTKIDFIQCPFAPRPLVLAV